MQIHRVYEPQELKNRQQLTLSDENARIVRSVLRLEKGNAVEILNGRGSIAQAELSEVGKKQAIASITAVQDHPPLSPAITLLQGLPKGEKSTLIVQKAVELGVVRILFFESGHTIAKKKAGQSERWLRVAVEAIRQSGNPFLPDIPDPISLSLAIAQAAKNDCRIMLDENERTKPLREQMKGTAPASIALAIGPEGGWSPADHDLLKNAQFQSAGLGPYVLRTETAAIAAVSAVRALLS